MLLLFGRQHKQPIQPNKLSPLFLLSCFHYFDDNINNPYNQASCPRCLCCRAFIILTTTETTHTTKQVVPIVSVVVLLLFGRQQKQPVQPSKLFPLFMLSCFHYFDDNRNNPDNQASCSRCFCYTLSGTKVAQTFHFIPQRV